MSGCAIVPNETPFVERRLRRRPNDPMSRRNKLRQNNLLAALTEDELLRLRPHLELIPMQVGQVLCEAGEPFSHVYFPTTLIVSNPYLTEEGTGSEIEIVGKEGLIGAPVFMGGGSSPSQVVVLRGGCSYRIQARFLLGEFNHAGPLMHILLRYAHARMLNNFQAGLCNRRHRLSQQLCRFLLLMLDLQKSNQMMLTQDLIADVLDARRENLTEAATKLQHDGVIRYSHRHLEVLDRHGLEQSVCECYRNLCSSVRLNLK